MFLRWRRRLLRREQDMALDALLVQSVWTDGRSRQQVVRYLATIQERYRLAPAHRHAFWRGVERRLATLNLSPAVRQALEGQLAQQVPLPSMEELVAVMAQRRTLAQWAALPPSYEVPGVHGNAGLRRDGHQATL